MNTTPPSHGSSLISVTEPVSRALDWTNRVLFKPFDARKWFVLGFCAWLAFIGQGGSGGNGNWDIPGDDPKAGVDAVGDWIHENLALFIVIVVIVVLLIVGLVVLLTWLSSRGKLMFVDGVLQNRGAVVEPWHRFRDQANSLFGFRVVVGLIALAVFGLLGTLLVFNFIAMDIENSDFGPGVILVICLWVALFLVLGIAFGLVEVALNDMIVPIMWLRGCRVMEAWSEFLPLLQAHAGTFVLYVLMKILLAIVIGVISCLAVCVTCCVAALPYLGTVILLPLFVFRRSYSLYFISQLSPDYVRLAPVDLPPVPPASPTPVPPQDRTTPPEEPNP